MQVDPVRPPFGQCLGWVSSPWSGVTAVTRYSINALQVISPLEKLPTFDICILYTNSCTYSKIRAIPAQKGLESIYIYTLVTVASIPGRNPQRVYKLHRHIDYINIVLGEQNPAAWGTSQPLFSRAYPPQFVWEALSEESVNYYTPEN